MSSRSALILLACGLLHAHAHAGEVREMRLDGFRDDWSKLERSAAEAASSTTSMHTLLFGVQQVRALCRSPATTPLDATYMPPPHPHPTRRVGEFAY